MEPLISIIVPTRNSASTLKTCLHSIRQQDYPRDKIQLIIADANSEDESRALAQEYHAAIIVENPLKTGETGKAAALRHAAGEFVAFIDSDNYLPGNDWLRRMVAPFAADPHLTLAEPLFFHHNPASSGLNRYCALMGLNDPLCYYTGNFDRWNIVRQTWTLLPLTVQEEKDWLWFDVNAATPLPTVGANGTIYRRSALQSLTIGDYFFDVDIPRQLAQAAPQRFAKVKIGIEHDYARNLGDFARKQHRRIRDYYQHRGQRLTPDSYSRGGLLAFSLSTLLIFPALLTAWRGFGKKADVALFFHWPLCALTLWIYGWTTLRYARRS